MRTFPYLYIFFEKMPAFRFFYSFDDPGRTLIRYDSECQIDIRMTASPYDYVNNENYNMLFDRKYSAFKNKSITSISKAELNYYVMSASQLGWINCDYFWNSPEKKIDYIINILSSSKTNIKLIFKQAKSIMQGVLDGDQYVFKNVPENLGIKVVAITYQRNKPWLYSKLIVVVKFVSLKRYSQRF